jgi:glycosyltransferase 2 family protein
MTNGITGTIQARVWSGIGVAIGLLIVVVAGATLFRLVRDIDLDEVVAALQAKSLREAVIAGGFVFAGYVTLTLYDFFALRTIGRDTVPYRIAALASFTSYTIGHNLGATVLTGGAIRFRIYSAWGLGIIDVAKIAFVTGLTSGSAMRSCSASACRTRLRPRAPSISCPRGSTARSGYRG